MTPSGARCFRHPDAVARGVCARCGTFFCDACSGPGALCLECQQRVPLEVAGGVGERFIANLLDHAVALTGPLAVLMIGGALSVALGLRGHRDTMLMVGSYLTAGLAFCAGLGVQIYFQLTRGRSVGKWVMRLKVVRLNGDAVNPWRVILLRNAAMAVVSQACGLVGLVDPLLIFRVDRRCLHDLLADTRVIVADRE